MASWWQDARRNPLFALTCAIGAGILLLDQASKLWILHGLKLRDKLAVLANGEMRNGHVDLTPFFDLTYVENRGVSFGLLAGGMVSRVLLSVLAVVISGFVLHWAARLDRKVAAIGAGLIIGGAIGNAVDRVAYGYVVDFFDFSGLFFPWVFNVADVCINLGVACLIYDAFVVGPKTQAVSGDTSGDSAKHYSTGADRPKNITKP